MKIVVGKLAGFCNGVRNAVNIVEKQLESGTIYCLGASLCIAVGIYYCYLSSKKRKYYNKLGYTFDDIKASFYDLRKDQAKIDEFNKKRKEKIKENEKNNVKIPYIYMILLGVIGFVVETIGTLIAVI